MKVNIETERLIIRDFELQDWTDVYDYASDPDATRFMFDPQPAEVIRESVYKQALQKELSNRRVFDLAVVLKGQQKVVGDCALMFTGNPMFHPKEAMIHYCINREYWGHGIATETVSGMLQFAFNKLNLHRIQSKLVVENAASAKVLEKNGFRKEGLLREEALIKGQWHDEYLYAILDHEWKKHSLNATQNLQVTDN